MDEYRLTTKDIFRAAYVIAPLKDYVVEVERRGSGHVYYYLISGEKVKDMNEHYDKTGLTTISSIKRAFFYLLKKSGRHICPPQSQTNKQKPELDGEEDEPTGNQRCV